MALPLASAQPGPPAALVLRRDPAVRVMTPALGLTLYLDAPGDWRDRYAADAFRVFLEVCPPDTLRWFWTSLEGRWHPYTARERTGLEQGLSTGAASQPRHLLRVRVCDDPGAPTAGFTYREVDERGAGCTGFLQLLLPIDTRPALLQRLATWAMRHWPLWSGIGGHVVSWNEDQRPTVAHALPPWLHRYLGMDVQDADAMSWKARTALPGTSWLTLIGAPLAAAREIDLAALETRTWKMPVDVFRGKRALLLGAGPEPTLGDLHTLARPDAYAEVATALAPYLVEEPPRIFDSTDPWLHRFLQPADWS